jgi:carbon-monoxide dehydrogenase iron sulfur subunit
MACTSDAISIDEHTGIVRLDEEACVGCWLCIEACPFGAIVRRSDGETAVKCDRCGDREIPACVEACPTGALIFCEKEEYEALISEGGAVQRN